MPEPGPWELALIRLAKRSDRAYYLMGSGVIGPVAGPVVVDPVVLPVVVHSSTEPLVVPLAAGPLAAELPPTEQVAALCKRERVGEREHCRQMRLKFHGRSRMTPINVFRPLVFSGWNPATACTSVSTRRQSSPIERHSGWNLSQTSLCQLSRWRCIP